jgi:hypothetical protein
LVVGLEAATAVVGVFSVLEATAAVVGDYGGGGNILVAGLDAAVEVEEVYGGIGGLGFCGGSGGRTSCDGGSGLGFCGSGGRTSCDGGGFWCFDRRRLNWMEERL